MNVLCRYKYKFKKLFLKFIKKSRFFRIFGILKIRILCLSEQRVGVGVMSASHLRITSIKRARASCSHTQSNNIFWYWTEKRWFSLRLWW